MTRTIDEITAEFRQVKNTQAKAARKRLKEVPMTREERDENDAIEQTAYEQVKLLKAEAREQGIILK